MTLEEPKKQIADDESEMMEVKHAWLTEEKGSDKIATVNYHSTRVK